MKRHVRGFALLPITLMIGMLAVVAFLVTHDGTMSTELLNASVDADTAGYVADAGLEHARWTLETSGCSGDAALASTALGSHSYSASISAGGTSTTASFTSVRDSFIRDDDPSRNEGSKADVHIRSELGMLEQALVAFDLSSLAVGTRIHSATLWLHLDLDREHPEGPLSVHRVLADWDETTVTWDSFAASYDPSPIATVDAQETGDVWVALNLTAQVQAWVNGEANFGVLLASSAEGIHAHYTSREGASANRPRMDVVTGTGSASPATIQVTGTLANGVTRARARTGVPAYQPESVITEQPDAAGRDTTLSEASPGTGYADSDDVWIAKQAGNDAVALFEFDLAAVPPLARIQSASLSLYHRSGAGSGVPITAHRITRSWSESLANWTTREWYQSWSSAGGDYDAQVVATTEVGPASNVRYEWDLTELARGWAIGSWPNHGVLLRTSLDGTTGERFYTSDHGDPSQRPRLHLTYTCECGVACTAPAASGTDVMMLVKNPFAPDPSDALKKAVLEAWGYTVYLVDDDTTGFWWDLAIDANDVVYLSATVDPAKIGTRLTGERIGVVSEAGALNDELEIASGMATPTGSSVQVDDVAHPITFPFTTGPRPLYTAAMQGTAVSGGVAPGAQTLARWGGADALIALDRGAITTSGGLAAERRVLLPVGGGESIDWTRLTTDAWVMIHRSLQWAARESGPAATGPELWITTRQDVSKSGAPGLDEWSAGAGLAFGEPDFVLEPGTTGGTFSEVFDLDDFGGGAELDALHRVETNLTVGASISLELFPGDLLLSTANDESLSSTNAMKAADEDVFVFRPDVAGDYSAGTFLMLIDGSMLSIDDTIAVSLVEKSTTLGDVTIPRGSFLLASENSNEDVMQLIPKGVGEGTTGGSYTRVIDLSELELESDLRGLDLAEDPVNLGGHTIPTGALVVAVETDQVAIGDNEMSVEAADVFYLTVTAAGGDPEADVTLLFEGSDVALGDAAENLDGVSLKGSVTPDPESLPVAHWTFDDGSGGIALDSAGDHDGTLENGPSWTSDGTLEGALEFDGSDDQVVAPHDEALALTEAVTLTAWMRNDEPGIAGTHRIVGKETSGSNDGYWMAVEDAQLWAGIGGSVFSPGVSLIAGQWTHVAVSYDATAGEVRMYVDGVERLVQPTTATLAANTAEVVVGADGESTKHFRGGLDDVRIYADPLSAEAIAELATPPDEGGGGGGDLGGGGGGGSASYVEAFASWVPDSNDTWEAVDLARLGVPANAVVEIAVRNDDTENERWGGVRAVGSSLDRRLQLHKAESGGLDVIVMHAQADASSRIEAYSDNRSDVTFALLGYWTGAAYEERFASFEAGSSGSWREHRLAAYGVASGQIAEISISNTSTSSEYEGGARASSSRLERRLDLHEAESGGVDAATLMVQASGDADATIQIYAESDSNLDFHLLGFWSDPPGRYQETFAALGKPSTSQSWVDRDLTGERVPAGAVAQIAMANDEADREAELGLRQKGSVEDRVLDLQEAEAGGDNLATLHVRTDDAATIEWYDEDRSRDHEFTLLGWWEL